MLIRQRAHERSRAFTIVELLVVIVVIGILASITIVSYAGISKRATIASLKSDLTNDVKMLKMYNAENGYYPSTFNGTTNCPSLPVSNTNYCLKFSPDTIYEYFGGSQSFILKVKRNGVTYFVNETGAMSETTVPVLANNTATNIATTSSTLGSTIIFDGGENITESGLCWGTSAGSITNCQINSLGALYSMTPATVSNGGDLSEDVVISPDQAWLYLTNASSNVIYAYSRDIATGVLTPRVDLNISTGVNTQPAAIIISADGTSIYVTNYNNGGISMFSRSVATGALTSQGVVAGVSNSSYLAITPDGGSVYGSDTNGNWGRVYKRDGAGVLTMGGSFAVTQPNGVVVSPDSKYVYVAAAAGSVYMYSRNLSTGALTALSTPSIWAGSSLYDMDISADGSSVYVASNADSKLVTLSRDGVTGLLSNRVPIAATGIMTVSVSPDGNSVYGPGYGNGLVSMFSRNSSTGALTALSPATISATYGHHNLTFSSDSKTAYGGNWTGRSLAAYYRLLSISSGTFGQNRTGLPSGTTIYYRGYATNVVGTGYSAYSTFVTP